MTASPADAGAGMPSEEEIARAMAAADSGPEGSALFAIHWGEFGAGYRNSARAALSLIRPAFEAKEREIEFSAAKLARAKAEIAEMAEARAALSERALSAEAKLREANMQALSDEGQMREIQAKLAQAVGELSGLQQAILDAAVICDDDEKAGDRLDKLARAIRARSTSEHLTDRGEG